MGGSAGLRLAGKDDPGTFPRRSGLACAGGMAYLVGGWWLVVGGYNTYRTV